MSTMVVAAAKVADRSVNVRYRPLMSVLHCVPTAYRAYIRRIRGQQYRWRQRKLTVTNGNNGFCLAALMLLAALYSTPHTPKGCKPDRKSALKEQKGLKAPPEVSPVQVG
jgi:hypothetical protein